MTVPQSVLTEVDKGTDTEIQTKQSVGSKKKKKITEKTVWKPMTTSSFTFKNEYIAGLLNLGFDLGTTS